VSPAACARGTEERKARQAVVEINIVPMIERNNDTDRVITGDGALVFVLLIEIRYAACPEHQNVIVWYYMTSKWKERRPTHCSEKLAIDH
jgi:hypothetical protein